MKTKIILKAEHATKIEIIPESESDEIFLSIINENYEIINMNKVEDDDYHEYLKYEIIFLKN